MRSENPTGRIESETAEQARENIRKLMEGGGEMAENRNMREHYEIIARFDHGELPGSAEDVDEFLMKLGNYRLLSPVAPEDSDFVAVRYAEVSEDD